MTFDIAVTLAVLAAAVALFVSERLRVDLVALLVMVTLVLTGVIEPEAGVRGFANPATITVAALFVLSAALVRTGATGYLGDLLGRVAEHGELPLLVTLMVVVGALSAFLNNTATVALMLPVVLGVAGGAGLSPSKLLMPLSFASLFGGCCTLIGTSTNILADTIARRAGAEPFGMFEFLPLGLVLFVAGGLYLVLVGRHLIPERRPAADPAASFHLAPYLTEVRVEAASPLVGRTLGAAALPRRLGLEVLELVRSGGERFPLPSADKVLQAGDLLRVRADVERIRDLPAREGLVLVPRAEGVDASDTPEGPDAPDAPKASAAPLPASAPGDPVVLVEALVPPGSGLDGRSLAEARFRNVSGATVLALRHGGRLVHERLREVTLGPGDTLLLELRRDLLEPLRAAEDVLVLSSLDAASAAPGARRRMALATAILAGVVVTAALGWLPILISAICGCLALVLTGCLSLDEAYEAIEWKVVFLLAGLLALGEAMDSSGAARLLATGLVDGLGPLGPVAMVSGLYLLTSLLTEAMSNNATVALLAPVAVATADALGVDSRPFLMAVTFAASASFMTPVGYQTNTLVHGPGQYRFVDFLRVGTPLNLLFWILASVLIPVFWPF